MRHKYLAFTPGLLLLAGCASIFITATGCASFVNASVDTLAASHGVITTAQAQNLSTCQKVKDASICLEINQAVDAQNAAIDGLEAYCQLPVEPDPATLAAQGGLVCNANPSAKAAFVAELNALGKIVGALKASAQ